MNRETLVEDFEAGIIDNSMFGHADHVFVIWSLIRRHGTLEAVRRFETSLKRITADAGHPEKYNATITHALGFLTAERFDEHPSLEWDDFVRRNPDLLQWPNELLNRLYPNGSLRTERARRSFVLPGGIQDA
jgi:hypothetical protein